MTRQPLGDDGVNDTAQWWRRGDDRRFFAIIFYGFPGADVPRAVVDDFGNLVGVSR